MSGSGEIINQAVQEVVALCIKFEGIYLRPYTCPAGVATIGAGTTRYPNGLTVRLTDAPITRTQAIVIAKHQICSDYIPGVLRLCPGIDTPYRLAAITDFAYNLGLGNLKASTLRRRVNAGRWDDVPAELRKWIYAAGRVQRGLVRRREAEIALLRCE